jgi:hypothetical protein
MRRTVHPDAGGAPQGATALVVLPWVSGAGAARTQGARMKAAQCAAITRGGSRCASAVLAGSLYCWTHDPAAADRRREASKKGGKARANAERAKKLIPEAMSAEDLAGWLSLLFTNVMTGRIEPKIGTACATIARTLHEVKHATDLEERIAELEQRAGVTDTRWRA